MNRQKAPRRPAAGGTKAARDWDERPAKKLRAARPDPDGYDFYDEEEYEGKKPPRGAPVNKGSRSRPREVSLPFEDDLFPDSRMDDGFSERGTRDAQRRPAAKPRGGVNSARGRDFDLGSGYGEPVRRARAQRPRPVDYDRFSRDGFYEDDRPIRRAKPGRKKKKKTSGALVYWATAIVLALLIGFGVRTFGFELIRVSGNAMDMTLSSGEIVLVQKSVYYATKPARGDIVGVNSPEGLLIRRVVALPGETIEIKGGVTYVNGEALEEPYVFQKDSGDCPLTTIPDGCYFVMGDNRVNTDDSRTFGLIKNTRSLIVGKVNSIVWPLDQWGTIH